MDIQIQAKLKSESGKGRSRKLRKAGNVPAVVYGPNQKAIALAVENYQVEKILTTIGRRRIMNMMINDASDLHDIQVMFKDIQRNPLTGELLHVDFYAIKSDEKLNTIVPLLLQGVPVGVKDQGGTLQFLTRQVRIQCLPNVLPEYLRVDISNLALGQTISISDIEVDSEIKILEDRNKVIASVITISAASEHEKGGAETAADETSKSK